MNRQTHKKKKIFLKINDILYTHETYEHLNNK